MGVIFTATGRHYSQASVGSTHTGTNLDEVAHIISADENDLETRVNEQLVAFTTAQTQLYVAAASIGGAGDGHRFCVALVGNPDTSGGVPGGPAVPTGPGLRAFFYKAASEHELQVQCTRCMARIATWLDNGGAGDDGNYIDWQIAGAAQGTVVMGMILVYRVAPQ